MNDAEINDLRQQREFRGITFSGFNKSHVKQELTKGLYNSKIEPSCYWSAEMVCAGHFYDLWEIIIAFYTKFVHIANPKLIIYLDLRIEKFKEIVANGYADNEIRLRNTEGIRKLFCEVMCVLCEVKKKHNTKVHKEQIELIEIEEYLKAPNDQFVTNSFFNDDPKELFIAANELAFHLTAEERNTLDACYWLDWIIKFDSICKQKKEQVKCERRAFANVDVKSQMDIVWIVWDIFLNEANQRSELVQRIVSSALNLFCLKYQSGCLKRRKGLLIFAIEILTENYHVDEVIFKDVNKIHTITKNIGKIYREIKKNEHSPSTDYLYTNVKSYNLEKTIRNLETMNSLGAEYIPRTEAEAGARTEAEAGARDEEDAIYIYE